MCSTEVFRSDWFTHVANTQLFLTRLLSLALSSHSSDYWSISWHSPASWHFQVFPDFEDHRTRRVPWWWEWKAPWWLPVACLAAAAGRYWIRRQVAAECVVHTTAAATRLSSTRRRSVHHSPPPQRFSGRCDPRLTPSPAADPATIVISVA